ncbi:MAG: sigma 54-interacting transcriptional regulator [Vicinamibacterales bacterium]
MQLLHDRYAVIDDRAYDLVEECGVALEDIGRDESHRGDEELPPLGELMDHGRDGAPRWVVADARSSVQAAALGRRAAAAARRRGFVALSVDSFERLHARLADLLRDRALLLIGTAGGGADAALHPALLAAAALSSRPHVLLTLRVQRGAGSAQGPGLVREARAAYGPALARAISAPPPAPDVVACLERASRAHAFVAEGRHAAAERLLRDVLGSLERRRAYSEAGQLALRLVALLARRCRLDAADAACADALRLVTLAPDPPLLLRVRLQEGMLRLARGRYVEAESIARAVLLAAPPDPVRLRALRLLALSLLHQARVDEAVRLERAGATDAGADPLDAAELRDTAVRVLLAAGESFEAGALAAGGLDTARASGHPEALFVAYVTELRVLSAAGALDAAAQCWPHLRVLEVRARLPIWEAEGTLVWCDALRRAGRARDARAASGRLARLRQVVPPILREGIDAVLQPAPAQPACGAKALTALGPEIVRLGYDADEDADAIRRVLTRVASDLAASRIDVVTGEGGPATVTLCIGTGLETTLGRRALESGITLGFAGAPDSGPAHAGHCGREAAVPIRRGVRLLGAIVCRWPIDRPIPVEARAALELTAAVLSPRLDALQARGREEAAASVSVPELVGGSAAMDEVRRAIGRAARAPFAVLIEGESGTGKELVARAIHHLGPRRERRFCDINCAALPDELLESELFGHARGAFTGALVERAGLFEAADGGTLFMDEVADLSPRAQAKLLRVVQQQEVRRVGETISRKIDVRLVAAANRDLQAEADAGRFRADLLYRLNVIRIRLPPLRERAADIPALARHFWREAAERVGSRASLTPAVFAALAAYSWPGNVRELQNVMAAMAVAAPAAGRVGVTLLPALVAAPTVPPTLRLADARDQFERRYVEAALARAGGSRTRAAASLGITRQGLLKTMGRLGVR